MMFRRAVISSIFLSLLIASLGYAQAKRPPAASKKQTAAPKSTPKKTPVRPAKEEKGVRAMFAAAQELFNAGKFNEALLKYDAILRKYPGHEPTMIQYAKTLYRLEKYPEAFTVFQRINPQYLDAETSYEYGYSFYNAKQYDGAYNSFRRVSQGHALYDLANYYGALCAIKLRKYEEAEDMLEKAVVLPDKLAKSRLLYLKHVQTLRLLKQQQELDKERGDEKKRLTQQKNPTNGKSKDPEQKVAAHPPGSNYLNPVALRYEGIVDVDRMERYVKFVYMQTEQNQDYHENNSKVTRTDGAEMQVAGGNIFYTPFKPVPNKELVLGFQISAMAEDKNTKGKEQRVVVLEDSSDIPRIQSFDIEKTHTKGGKVGGSLWSETPLPNNFWLGAVGDMWFYFPEFERASRYGSGKGTLFFGHNSWPHLTKVRISYEQLIDKTNQPSVDIVSGDASYKYRFPFGFSIQPGVQVKTFNYQDPTVEGPDLSAALTTQLGQGLPAGFWLGLFGSYEHQSHYLKTNLPSYNTAYADADVLTGRASLVAEPFPWLFGSVEQTFQKMNYTVEDPERESVFKQNTVDLLSVLDIQVGINVIF